MTRQGAARDMASAQFGSTIRRTYTLIICSFIDQIVLQSPRQSDAKPLLRRLHWLSIKQSIVYKTAALTFKVRTTATPAYLSCHLQTCHSARHLRSSGTPLLSRPSSSTDFAARGFIIIWLVAWHSGRTSVFGRRTYPVLRSTCRGRVTTYVGKTSTIGQPTRPTQPFIPSGSIAE